MPSNRSPNKILNPATKRWVNINGKIGMELRNKHTLKIQIHVGKDIIL